MSHLNIISSPSSSSSSSLQDWHKFNKVLDLQVDYVDTYDEALECTVCRSVYVDPTDHSDNGCGFTMCRECLEKVQTPATSCLVTAYPQTPVSSVCMLWQRVCGSCFRCTSRSGALARKPRHAVPRAGMN